MRERAKAQTVALFGQAVLLLVLGLLVYATSAGSYAARRARRRLLESSVNALVAAFAGTALAAGTLLLAFVRNDFSLSYVAGHSAASYLSATRLPRSGRARRARCCSGCSC
jgi:cytochrome c biogenesis factor